MGDRCSMIPAYGRSFSVFAVVIMTSRKFASPQSDVGKFALQQNDAKRRQKPPREAVDVFGDSSGISY
ncbi:hypothetical protein BaRGS_00032538 [Batillaria attramentaria]|uniref:Uncharacterized protein n=1 Tax=Batillaria attramentaria TaxID=370345 RepID=A0ABD0JMX2_9CAEN